MKLLPQNIIHHELIGIDTRVVDSTNSSLIGTEGRIIDETKNLFIIETDAQEKKVPKSCSSFIFTLPSHDGKRYLPLKLKVDGRLLLSQPENRIQTKFKRKFRK
jgi:ribonuclease P protein subunit POP4